VKFGVREATEQDIETLSVLASSTFIGAYDDLSPDDSSKYVSDFFTCTRLEELIRSPESRILVADEGSLVGYILLENGKAPVPTPEQHQVECVRLFVDKDAQGREWGSKLLDEGLRASRQDGFDLLWLKVWDQNHKAIRFYQKRGFCRLGEVDYKEGGLNDRVVIMGRSV